MPHRQFGVVRNWMRSVLTGWNFWLMHFSYFLALSFIGGTIITIADELSFMDGLFTAVSSVCVTGLVVVDTEKLSFLSQFVILTLALVGGVVPCSLFSPLLRLYFIKRAVSKQISPQNVASEDTQVGTEYRAIRWLIGIVLVYYAFFLLLGFIILTSYCAADTAGEDVLDRHNISAPWLGAFTTGSALNNAGFTLLSTSLVRPGFSLPIPSPPLAVYLFRL